jgi:hypothetical protein
MLLNIYLKLINMKKIIPHIGEINDILLQIDIQTK